MACVVKTISPRTAERNRGVKSFPEYENNQDGS